MRQAIRVYAIVALVAMVGLWVLQTAWWAGAVSFTASTGLAVALELAMEAQLWLLVMPLGVLATSDAARAGRRGWLWLFIALMVVAPFAANIETLSSAIQPGSLQSPQPIVLVGWAVAFLLVPLAALIYSLMSAQPVAGGVEAAPNASQGERRTLIISACAGIVVMSVLSYLMNSQFLFSLPLGTNFFDHTMLIIQLQGVARALWFTLAPLPVTVASLALAHAAQTSRRGWLAGWIALIPLALLTADLGSPVGIGLIAAVIGARSSEQIPFFDQLPVASIVAPAVIMLVALLYALTVMRPRGRAAAIAVA